MNNNTTIKLPNVILIKVINYLTSFYEGSKFGTQVNELFTIVFNNIVRDLSMVSKEWYDMVSRGLILPNYYLMNENHLETNKSIQRMIKADSTFIKIGIATQLNFKSYTGGKRLIEKYSQSISTLSLEPSSSSIIQSNNSISPWRYSNINKLEIILTSCKTFWSSYLRNLFPIEMFNYENVTEAQKELLDKLLEKKNRQLELQQGINSMVDIKSNDHQVNCEYNSDWTKRIERLIISRNQGLYDGGNLDLSILNDFISLGGFERLYYLKLVSNNKEINNYAESLIFQKVSHLSLYGIKIKLDSFSGLLESKSNHLKHLEILQCTTDKDKSYGLNLALSKYISSRTCKLESYHHDTFESQDINSIIILLNSSQNSSLNTTRIKSQLDLSNNSNSSTDINSLPFNTSTVKFISLVLPDPSFIKFIFSKVSFNLSTLNLNFIKSNIGGSSDAQNENGYYFELVDIILQILDNQSHCLNTLRLQLNQNECDKIKKSSSYPSNCNMKKLFKFIQDKPNQIQEIDLKNIWISKSTVTESLLSFNTNPNSLVRYYSIEGVSDIESKDLITNIDDLFINNCKLLTLGLSLSPLNSQLPKPSSFVNRFARYSSILSSGSSSTSTYIHLLIKILERNKTIEHIMVDEYDEILFNISDSTKKKLERAIISNSSLVSIGIPNYLSSLIPSSKSIYPYFNPIIR